MLLDKTDIYFLCKDWTSTLVKMASPVPQLAYIFQVLLRHQLSAFQKTAQTKKLFSSKKKVGLRYHSRFKCVLSIYATTIFPYEQKCVEFKSKIDTKPTLSTRLMMPSLIARYSLKLSFKTCSIKTHSKI
jgi:hypothetical protein